MPRPPSINRPTVTSPSQGVPPKTAPEQERAPVEPVPDRQFVCTACHRAKPLRDESPDAKVCSECHLLRLEMRKHGHYDGTGPLPSTGPTIAEINGDEPAQKGGQAVQPSGDVRPKQEAAQALTALPKDAFWDSMKLAETHARRLTIIQDILRLDGNIDQARSLLKTAEGQVELHEAEALLNVEGKNTEQRQAALLLALAQDELYQKLKTQKGMLEAQVQDSRRQRDALAMEFGALGDYMALCRARVAFLGSG